MKKNQQINSEITAQFEPQNYKQICDRIFFSKDFQNILNKKIHLLASEVKFQFYQQLKKDIQNLHLNQNKINPNKTPQQSFYKPPINIRNYTHSNYTRSASNNVSGSSESYNIFDNPLQQDQINSYVNSFISKIKIQK